MRSASRVLLDFSSSFVRYLVTTVTSPEFGGGYGIALSDREETLIAAMLVHYQNEQGDARGVDLLAGGYVESHEITIDNAVLRPLFVDPQRTGATVANDPARRKDTADAILDRIEVQVAEASEISRHARGIFPIAFMEFERKDKDS